MVVMVLKKLFENYEMHEMSNDDKVELGKYALIFMSGIALGYGVKKALDSPQLKNIKNNAATMISEYVNPTIEYVDIDENDVVTEVITED